jgi:hypothetical protein
MFRDWLLFRQRPTTVSGERQASMARDIDYAAIAVSTAIAEKFGRKNDLRDLVVTANERTISIHDGHRKAEGTRDDLLAAVREAESYSSLWEILPKRANSRA